MGKRLLLDGRRHDVVLRTAGESFSVTEGDREVTGERVWRAGTLVVTLAGRALEAYVTRGADGRLELWIDSERHAVEEDRLGGSGGATDGGAAGAPEEDLLIAPMPARVVRVTVAAGQDVTEGQTLLVLESMKMELEVSSPRAGRVARVSVEAGQLVPAGTPLVELAPTTGVGS